MPSLATRVRIAATFDVGKVSPDHRVLRIYFDDAVVTGGKVAPTSIKHLDAALDGGEVLRQALCNAQQQDALRAAGIVHATREPGGRELALSLQPVARAVEARGCERGLRAWLSLHDTTYLIDF